MGAILGALDGLDGESIQRVLDYVFGRLSIDGPRRLSPGLAVSATPGTGSMSGPPARQPSIRDLKDDKQPNSANQMAAIVAYYLSELAGEEERKRAIGAEDLERYFKQAGFKLPKAVSQALPNAAAAGYFEPAGKGLWRLNPVGYNLVVHGLPRAHGETGSAAKRSKNGGR
jgi:hypothetical protein